MELLDTPLQQRSESSVLSTIGLPTAPVELAQELDSRLARYTSRVDEALTLSLRADVLDALASWFGSVPPEADQAFMKKISNALVSAGKGGSDRTVNALNSISPLTWSKAESNLDPKSASEILRDRTADFRRASAFLDHQAKCIKSILRIGLNKTESIKEVVALMNQKVTTNSHYEKWINGLAEVWINKDIIEKKNQSMYVNYWKDFNQFLLNDQGNDYADELAEKTKKYLNDSNQLGFIRNYARLKDSIKKVDLITAAPKSTLKLAGGSASLETTFALSIEKVEQIKDDLLFMFASDKFLQNQNLSIATGENDPQSIIIRFTPPKEMLTSRRVIQALNLNIEKVFEQISKI